MTVPMLTVPAPLVLEIRLGAAGAAAWALGISSQLAAAFCGSDLKIDFSSTTLILSALSVNCTCGAVKFFAVRLPLALVEPIPAFRFSNTAESFVNLRSALRICSGFVSVSELMVAFCSLPLPLRFIAPAPLIGPTACRSSATAPEPFTPSTALAPYALAIVSNSPKSPFSVFTVASTNGLGDEYFDSANCTATFVCPVEAVKLLDRIVSGESATWIALSFTGDFNCAPEIVMSCPERDPLICKPEFCGGLVLAFCDLRLLLRLVAPLPFIAPTACRSSTTAPDPSTPSTAFTP